jgi:hypothetical protein
MEHVDVDPKAINGVMRSIESGVRIFAFPTLPLARGPKFHHRERRLMAMWALHRIILCLAPNLVLQLYIQYTYSIHTELWYSCKKMKLLIESMFN